MKRKLLAILTSVLLLCAMLPLGAIFVAAATAGTTGSCTWTLDGTHLTISGNGAMGDYEGTRPWGKSITSVTIGDGVTTIGKSAFYECSGLTSVTIPGSVTSIGYAAFYNCDSLTSVTIPDGVTSIGYEAFYDCGSLTSVTIPDSVISIGDYAFLWCGALASVTIGNGVTTIGQFAFYKCTSLTEVYYGGSAQDRAAMSVGSNNSYLTDATWYYNCTNPKDRYSAAVAHSVMDTEGGNGLAFRFELSANGVKMVKRTEADFANATVNYLGTDCKLVGMGAVITNNAAVGETKFTHADVNDYNVIDIPTVYLQEANEDSCAFAARIIDIPDTAMERTVYARPYYVVEVEGEEITVYGDVDAASCAEYM